jgi:hypothetical protein
MKNIAINNLKYTGIVTLSQYIGSKKVKIAQVHNSGGDSLFNFLASSLIGDFTMAKALRPTKIMLLKQENTSDEPIYRTTDNADFYYLLTRPEKITSVGLSRIKYSFLIPKEVIDSLADFEKLCVGLYADAATADEPSNYAAVCNLGISKNNVVSASLVVDWELIISNMITSE